MRPELTTALQGAKFERMENGKFSGRIPDCPGTWAEGETLLGCREELRSVLEDWILVKTQFGDKFPESAGIEPSFKVEQDAFTIASDESDRV